MIPSALQEIPVHRIQRSRDLFGWDMPAGYNFGALNGSNRNPGKAFAAGYGALKALSNGTLRQAE